MDGVHLLPPPIESKVLLALAQCLTFDLLGQCRNVAREDLSVLSALHVAVSLDSLNHPQNSNKSLHAILIDRTLYKLVCCIV